MEIIHNPFLWKATVSRSLTNHSYPNEHNTREQIRKFKLQLSHFPDYIFHSNRTQLLHLPWFKINVVQDLPDLKGRREYFSEMMIYGLTGVGGSIVALRDTHF